LVFGFEKKKRFLWPDGEEVYLPASKIVIMTDRRMQTETRAVRMSVALDTWVACFVFEFA
jgi:hypothetical protein